MNIWKILGFLIFVVLSSHGQAQTLKMSNVHFRKAENLIEIVYDLPPNRDRVEVKLFV